MLHEESFVIVLQHGGNDVTFEIMSASKLLTGQTGLSNKFNLIVQVGLSTQFYHTKGKSHFQSFNLSQANCIAAASFIQYFFLVTFMWMLIEGIQLYLKVTRVFAVHLNMPLCYLSAWGKFVKIYNLKIKEIGDFRVSFRLCFTKRVLVRSLSYEN